MAWTARKVPLPEVVEASDDIDQKARQLADLIRNSKHFIVFTGAGISTSAGPGRQRTTAAVSPLQAIPTLTHMALVELQNRGLMKYLVSQNCDGLHRRSGILPDKISELHGNNNREYCKDCGKEYIRDFRAMAPYTTSVHDHRTGRKCTLCAGPLQDSIINFGEPLPERALSLAFEHANKADLCLVLGSSLTVSPANEIPEVVGSRRRRGTNLVICNLQNTPLNGMAKLRVHARTDELMGRVMRELRVEVPGFVLRRRLKVIVEDGAGEGRWRVAVEGVDVDGTPVSFLRAVRLVNGRRVVRQEPFVFDLRGARSGEDVMEVKLELEFMGHYGEPNLQVTHEIGEAKVGAAVVYLLEYNPDNGEWKTFME
ncbi:hypothetical protein VTI74DRAFT_7507 [Chaetomium olivicolor]